MMKEQLKKLVKGSFIYGVGSFLSQFINILLLPVFTAYLTPKDYGVISIFTFLSFILTSLFSLGLGTSIGICYFDVKNKDKKSEIIWTSFVVLILSSLIMVFLGILAADKSVGLIFHADEYKYLFIINILTVFFSIIVNPLILKLQFEEKQKAFSAITVVSTLITILVSIFLVVILRRGVNGMMEGLLFSRILTMVLFARYALKGIKTSFNSEVAKEIVRYGLPMVPSFLSLYIIQQGNNYILQRYDSLEAAGIYSVGYNLGLGLLIVISAFSTAWAPFFLSYSDRKEEAKTIFGRVMTYYIFGAGILSLLFYIFAKPVTILLTKPEFYGAYEVIGLTATAQFLVGIFNVFLPPVYFAKEVKYTTIIQIISTICFVAISMVLVSMLGIIGAAVSIVAGYLIMDILLYLWNKSQGSRYLNIKYEWKRIAPFMVFYIISILFILVMRKGLSDFQIMGIYSLLLIVMITEVYLLLYPQEKVIIAKLIKSIIFLRRDTAKV